MTDRQHNDMNAKVRAIIDDTLADLLLLGMAGRDDAAMLMAVQASVRIESARKIEELAAFIETIREDGGG